MQPSSSPPESSPTALFETLRSFYVMLLTWCVSQEPTQLPLVASIHSEPSPISPFVPAPFSAAKLPILFGSGGLLGEILLNRLKTQSPKLLDPTSLHVPALACALLEAPEAHWLDLTLLPP